QNVPNIEIWRGASVGEPTAYTGSGDETSVLVFPIIKDQAEVGHLTLDVASYGCTVLEVGSGCLL
ncbi:MAG: hypothetical protein U9R72_09770, partial [Chloroflexota bacterium]|nr:hypothetical protein [Chloroflexota bacterium]